MDKLREKLKEITCPPPDAKADWLDKQIDEIQQLKVIYPHSIELFQRASVEIVNLNCYMYTLGISYGSIEDYVTGADGIPSSSFVGRLISDGVLVPSIADFSAAEDGIMLIYFMDNTCSSPTHAGIKVGNKVVSKWGWGGTHIWKHPQLEVPAQYGNYIRLYTRPARVELEQAYVSWLHE